MIPDGSGLATLISLIDDHGEEGNGSARNIHG